MTPKVAKKSRKKSRPKPKAAAREIEATREAATRQAATAAKPFDLADLTDEQFDRETALVERRLTRIRKIVDTRLMSGVHYGVPRDKDGVLVDGDKKTLLQAGAEELRKVFRFTAKRIGDQTVSAAADYYEATVSIGIYNNLGQLVCVRSGSSNSKEARFAKPEGGWKYTDAREVSHLCLTMAEKRATVLATREATGASALFATPEEVEAALALAEPVKAPTPCTPAEVKQLFADAKAVGIDTPLKMDEFVKSVLGKQADDFKQGDLPKLREELLRRKARSHTPVASGYLDIEKPAA